MFTFFPNTCLTQTNTKCLPAPIFSTHVKYTWHVTDNPVIWHLCIHPILFTGNYHGWQLQLWNSPGLPVNCSHQRVETVLAYIRSMCGARRIHKCKEERNMWYSHSLIFNLAHLSISEYSLRFSIHHVQFQTSYECTLPRTPRPSHNHPTINLDMILEARENLSVASS